MPPNASPRVDFVIGGVQKGGTTALDGILRRHPGIAMASVKEVHAFDRESGFARGMPDFAPYHAYWGERFGNALCGEATPAYVWWPPAAQRIRDYHPGMRWILCLRDPAERAYSQWNMERRWGKAVVPFEAALDAEVRRQVERPTFYASEGSYLSRGFYAQQIERLWTLFPREQTLVLRSEELRHDPTAAVGRVLAFLGAEPMGEIAPVASHVGQYDRPMAAATRASLARFFEPEIRRLEALLGWDCADWLR